VPEFGEEPVDPGDPVSEELISEEWDDSLRKAKGTSLPAPPGRSEPPPR